MQNYIKYNFLLTLLLVVGLSFGPATYAQTDGTTGEATTDPVDQDEVDEEVVNDDQTEPYETEITDEEQTDPEVNEPTEDDTESPYEDIDIEEEEISGEIVEIGDDYLIIETTDGEQRRISSGGSLLEAFVRQDSLDGYQVGDSVTITLAQEASLPGEVASVSADGTLTVTTSDGETRTVSPGSTTVVRRNGEVVTDFSTLQPGDEVELVFTGEVISDIDADGDSDAGWVIPVIIILIVLALAALLAKRNKNSI